MMKMSYTNACILSVTCFAVRGSPVQAAILFRDEFTASTQSDDVNFNINSSGRQSGSLVPSSGIAYVQGSGNYGSASGGGNGYQTQINNAGGVGKLWLVGQGGGNTSSVSVDHDFNENPGVGGYITIGFDLNPNTGSGPSGDWGGITIGAMDNSVFGASGSGARGQFINSSAAHFGILFKDNGAYETFDGNTGNIGTGNGSFGLDGPGGMGTHHYELRISGIGDGNPWDGNGDALIQAFLDNNSSPFFSYAKTGGYLADFITLQGYSEGFTIHEFDNFQVAVVSAVPEPSSVLIGGSLLSLAFLRRSRKIPE